MRKSLIEFGYFNQKKKVYDTAAASRDGSRSRINFVASRGNSTSKNITGATRANCNSTNTGADRTMSQSRNTFYIGSRHTASKSIKILP
jgi:hypothetical protein